MSGTDDLQFDKADYGGAEATCASCAQGLGGAWYLLGAQRVCPACRDQLMATIGAPIGAVGYAKALAAGALAGAACAVAWAVIREVTGVELGIVAIAVGWAVAEAMRRAAGKGARALQVGGVLIAYVAMMESNLPTLVAQMDLGESTFQQLFGWGFAGILALGMPLLVWQAGGSAVLWYVIVAIALHRAWTGLTPPRLAFVGPLTR